MLQEIAPNIWHAQHKFTSSGISISSRMTVVRLSNGGLWLHSPIQINAALQSQLAALGKVEYIIAPNKMHHLFAAGWVDAFPQAKFYGAPGLQAKRPDLKTMIELKPSTEPGWQDDLDQLFFDGLPIGNETVWFHKASRTLIITDLCQWWQGDLPFAPRMYARLTGVRNQLAVPRTVRMMIKDRAAAHASAQRILQWPFERVVLSHTAIVEDGAHDAVRKAFSCLEN